MKKIISLFFSLTLLTAPAMAFAATAAAGVTASVGTTGVGVKATAQATAETNAKARADKEIQRRIANLNTLVTRVNAMVNLSAGEKASLQASLSAEVSTLTTLQSKIDADTDLPTLKTDIKSITADYRVYMLILPQARIAASADRVSTIVNQMQALDAKLEARLTASTTPALQADYTDLQAKVADAATQAGAAVSATASLTPDDGNATVAASNTAALKAARRQITTATTDLKAARADIKSILQGLGVKMSATATVTAQ